MARELGDEEIADAFLAHLRKTGLEGMHYGDFWRVLQADGLRVEGRNPKVQRDRVYRLLSNDSRVEKSAPGYFTSRDVKST